MPQLYNQEGQPLDEDQLEFGDIVYDDEARPTSSSRTMAPRTSGEEEDEPVPELAGVGKSAFFEQQPQSRQLQPVGDGGALQGVHRQGPGRR